jgi:hypothetical protein
MTTYSAQHSLEQVPEASGLLFTVRGRLVVGAGIIALSLLIVSIGFYEIYAGTVSFQSTVHAAGGLPIVATSTSPAALREVHIANDGLVLLRGATITAIAGNALHVSLVWNETRFDWLVTIRTGTKLFTTTGEPGALATLQVGQVIDVTGVLTQGDSVPHIEAQYVRM